MKKNSSGYEQSSARCDRQWEIDRYLLGDPTLDRDAFEQRMLNDVSLAEQVAASVAQLELIELSAIAAGLPQALVVSPHRRRESRQVMTVWALLATVATLLVALANWRDGSSKSVDTPSVTFELAASDLQLAEIAEYWLATENANLISLEEEVSTEAFVNSRRGTQTEPESVEPTDWLVEAATQFYSENGEGKQG